MKIDFQRGAFRVQRLDTTSAEFPRFFMDLIIFTYFEFSDFFDNCQRVEFC